MKTIPQVIHYGSYDASLIYSNAVSTDLRRTSMYEFEYITYNGGTSYIDEKSYSIQKGGIILAKPGQIRHTDLPYRCLYIHIVTDDETLHSQLDSVPNFYLPPNANEFESAFRAFLYEKKFPKRQNEIDLTIKFLEILSLFIKIPLAMENNFLNPNRNTEIIHKAISFIDKNYTQKITLDDIAAYVHLSKIYFHNLFLNLTGQTPHEYLLTKRINNAKFLLAATDKSFSDIAYSSGFSSQTYMTYVFKKKTSCTPMQYKKKMAGL